MKPMIDLKRQYLSLKDEIFSVMNEVLESSTYILGAKGRELEAAVREYHGMGEAIGVASGTDALHLSLRALGIGPGDEVITTPFTFFATVEAILYTGARPVFVDVDPETLTMAPPAVEEKITSRTRAVMPVHLFGHPADMTGLSAISRSAGLRIVEDCAQSFGATWEGRRTGSFGDAACFSFYPSKNLGAFGDGGMILVSAPEVAEVIRKLRNHGSAGGYRHECIGYNSRLDELQAGILLVKFRRIEEYNRRRHEKAARYTQLLADLVRCPAEREGAGHVYHQYTIRDQRRDRIQAFLRDHGVASVVYYPVPLHLQEALRFLGHREGDFPVAETASREVLSLPMYPELDHEDIDRTAALIRTCLSET